MGEIQGSKLRHIIRVSWESEQMPGWEDTLSKILEATKKEFQIKQKENVKENIEQNSFENMESVLEEGFSK